MAEHGVKTLIYSSTCATYGEPDKMPITETTPQVSHQYDVSLFSISTTIGFHKLALVFSGKTRNFRTWCGSNG